MACLLIILMINTDADIVLGLPHGLGFGASIMFLMNSDVHFLSHRSSAMVGGCLVTAVHNTSCRDHHCAVTTVWPHLAVSTGYSVEL